MSEIVHNGSSQGAWTLPTDPHEEFRELCALATTGELTAEEWDRLTEHLAHCDACRQVKQQYEQVIATTIPALAAESAGARDEESARSSWSIEEAEARLMDSLDSEPAPLRLGPATSARTVHWNEVRRYAIAALILVAIGLAGYRIGFLQGHTSDSRATKALLRSSRTTPDETSRVPSAVSTPSRKPTSDNHRTNVLRDQVRQSQLETARLEDRLSELENQSAGERAELDRSLQDRAELNRELTQAQADAQTLQARLSAFSSQASQDTVQTLALKTRVEDLNSQIQAKDTEIAREQELLQHDRDIRNLIGARNLYIAEIYDVAKNGDTQKPFGRIFYTKDKSLVFYGYDLDQQKGIKKDTAFQAWGSRGADRQHAVSLGLLYQDDANKKRWVLKFNDAKTISDIDAVFITVEPEGGSAKPTGKPLLFTYLRLDPNHP